MIISRKRYKELLQREYDRGINRGYKLGYDLGKVEKTNSEVKELVELIQNIHCEADRLQDKASLLRIPRVILNAFEEENSGNTG